MYFPNFVQKWSNPKPPEKVSKFPETCFEPKCVLIKSTNLVLCKILHKYLKTKMLYVPLVFKCDSKKRHFDSESSKEVWSSGVTRGVRGIRTAPGDILAGGWHPNAKYIYILIFLLLVISYHHKRIFSIHSNM